MDPGPGIEKMGTRPRNPGHRGGVGTCAMRPITKRQLANELTEHSQDFKERSYSMNSEATL